MDIIIMTKVSIHYTHMSFIHVYVYSDTNIL